jgi:hypothetical protein
VSPSSPATMLSTGSARCVRPNRSFDEAFLAYRQQMFHGLIFWTYTLLVGKLQPVQPEKLVRILISRTAQVLVDLESLDSLG